MSRHRLFNVARILVSAFVVSLLMLPALAHAVPISHVHLDHSGAISHYATIQDAVDAAADGDIVTIDAGTYREQVTITKNITLQGAGVDTTIIEAPDKDDIVQSGGNWRNLKNQDIYAIIGIKTAVDGQVTIKDLTVDGRDQGYFNPSAPDRNAFAFDGIAVLNSTVTIDTVKVTSVRELASDFGDAPPAGYLPADQPAGVNHNEGIFAESAAGVASHTLTVQNSTVTKFQKSAILAWGPTLVVDIHNNTIQGYGKTLWSTGNGIQIASSDRTGQGGANGDRRGTTGVIRDNQILDMGLFIPPPGQPGSYLNVHLLCSSGVLLYQAGDGFQITGNTITRSPYVPAWHNVGTSNDGGFCNQAIDFDASANTVVQNNTISGWDFAIYGEEAPVGSQAMVSGNVLSDNGVDIFAAGGDDQFALTEGPETIGFYQTNTRNPVIANFGVGDSIDVIGLANVGGVDSVNGAVNGSLVVDFTGGTVTAGDGTNVAAHSVQVETGTTTTTLHVDTDGTSDAAELHVTLAGTYAPYNFTLDNGYIRYSARSLTVSGIALSDKAYDGTTAGTFDAAHATLSGIDLGDNVTLDTSHAVAAFADKNVGLNKQVTVTGLAVTGPNAAKYGVLDYTGTANIAAKALTATGIQAYSKEYDGSTSALISAVGAQVNGVISPDVVSLDTTHAVGMFDTAWVGAGKTVTVTGLTLTGAGAGNYTLNPYTTTAGIYPVPALPEPPKTPTDPSAPTEPTQPPAPPTQPDSGVEIIVNGVRQEDSAKATTTTDAGGKTVTTVTIDPQKLDQKLEQEGDKAVVTIPVETNADVVSGQLNADMVQKMETKHAVIEVKTPEASYTLPAERLKISAISQQLGALDPKEIKVQIEIAKPSNAEVKVVEDSAKKGEFTLMVPPVNFSVKVTHQNETVEVTKFDAYVQRTIAIPEGVDPTKITTCVIVEADGTVRHVPTKITIIDGKYYAQINSLTNSTYAVVWHPLEFSDVANHWAKSFVNEMGSRMVVQGTGEGIFEPDRGITRAEFAAAIVRALGLKPTAGPTPFRDVAGTAWYAGFVNTAHEYGILNGYEDGTFRPDQAITRQEAMVMIGRALKVAGVTSAITVDQARVDLARFQDGDRFANWAMQAAALCAERGLMVGANGLARPESNITRAETATLILRMLQSTGLI